MAPPVIPPTPQVFAAELAKYVVTPAKAQLNPKRTGTHDIARGRASVEYGGKTVVVCIGVQSAKRIRRRLVDLLAPGVNLGKVKGKIRDGAYGDLLARVAQACLDSERAADVGKMQDRILRNEARQRAAAEKAFVREAREKVVELFGKYGRVLDRETISDLWDEAVVKFVLET